MNLLYIYNVNVPLDFTFGKYCNNFIIKMHRKSRKQFFIGQKLKQMSLTEYRQEIYNFKKYFNITKLKQKKKQKTWKSN